jgi:phage tail-like protein
MDHKTATKLGCLVMGGLLLAAPTRRMEDFGDFIGNYNFRVEIDGVDAGRFKSVDGLSVELDVVEYREGGENGTVRKLPGRVKYGDITLKRGYVASTVLNDWIEAARCGSGDYTRKNMSIVLCDNSDPVRASDKATCSEWKACNVFPRRWKLVPPGGDNQTNVVMEEITFAVEDLIYEPRRLAGRDCLPPPTGEPPSDSSL